MPRSQSLFDEPLRGSNVSFAGGTREALMAIKSLRCAVCLRHRAKRAALKPARNVILRVFNDLLFLDIFYIEDATKTKQITTLKPHGREGTKRAKLGPGEGEDPHAPFGPRSVVSVGPLVPDAAVDWGQPQACLRRMGKPGAGAADAPCEWAAPFSAFD